MWGPVHVIVQNKVRFVALVQLVGALIYTLLSQSITSVNISWLHMLHFIVEPLIFFATLLDGSFITAGALISALLCLTCDVIIVVLNVIAIQRCLFEVSAICLTRILEDSAWIALGTVHSALGIYMLTLLYRLFGATFQQEKTYDAIVRARIMYEFQLIPDILWFFLTKPIGYQLMGAVHFVFNPIGIWATYRKPKFVRTFMSIFSFAVLIVDVFLFIMRMRTTPTTYHEYIDFIYGYAYIIFDIMLLIFTAKSFSQKKNL